MVVILLLYLASRCVGEDMHSKDILLLGAVGFIAIWISHPAAFVMAGVGLVLAFEKMIRRASKQYYWILGLGVAWIVSFGATYLVSLRCLIVDESLKNFWQNEFMPFPPWKNWGWFSKRYLLLLADSIPSLDYGYLALLCTILILIGLVSLFFRRRYIAFFIIMSAVMVFLASTMQIYPLRGRLILFLVPIIILLLAEGLGRIYSFISKWNHYFAFAIYITIALSVIWLPTTVAANNFRQPIMGDHIKPIMKYVSEHRTPDDIVYVYHGARPSFNYYAPFYNLDSGQVIAGTDLPNARALQQFYKQVNKLKGNSRVWIIFSHVVNCDGCEGDKNSFYIQYLNQFGTIIDQSHASGADVYLYNFVDSQNFSTSKQ